MARKDYREVLTTACASLAEKRRELWQTKDIQTVRHALFAVWIEKVVRRRKVKGALE